MAAGLADGSLPPLRADSVWIGRDDRARLVEWWKRDGTLTRAAGDLADLASAQLLLYGVAAGALLGVSVEEPGHDVMRETGRFLWFFPDEVEVVT